MDSEKKLDLIIRNTEEVLTEQDLKWMLETAIKLEHYVGFEISGLIHLGTGLMNGKKIADFQKAGATARIFLADWHSWINDKLGGNREVIKNIAGAYFKEGMKISLEIMGGDQEKVKFVLGTDLYHNNDDYWATVIDVSKNITLNRNLRSIDIMARKQEESIDFAKLIYPPMQVADIFAMGINLAHAGTDQRKAHVIAREVAEKLKINPLAKEGERYKPVAIHHHLILGLQKPPVWPIPKESIREIWTSMKMSKSIPGSAVFIHDSPEEIRQKLQNAFCPEKETDFNPVLDWCKHLLFSREKYSLRVERPPKFGGDITFWSFSDLEKSFREGKLHPLDLKKAAAESIIKLLEPARKHFEKPRIKKMKEEIERLKITR